MKLSRPDHIVILALGTTRDSLWTRRTCVEGRGDHSGIVDVVSLVAASLVDDLVGKYVH
jgi:hypothetical protein